MTLEHLSSDLQWRGVIRYGDYVNYCRYPPIIPTNIYCCLLVCKLSTLFYFPVSVRFMIYIHGRFHCFQILIGIYYDIGNMGYRKNFLIKKLCYSAVFCFVIMGMTVELV